MRPDTKLKVARRKHTLELLKWLYARRKPLLDGTKISLDHRRSLKENSRSLTYGEVDVPDFLSILDLVKPVQGEIFVDLGSGCRGIELVQGLADAAADHLQTAKAILANPRALSDENAVLTEAAGGAISGGGSTAGVASASPSTDNRGRGGGGIRRGGRQTLCKAAHQGLSAVQLETLIADLVSREQLSPQAKGAGRTDGDGKAERVALETTAEEIASWLVRELGHRRYKNSLRGYGGLQKFLVSRRGASDTSSRLEIREDGATVTVAPMKTDHLPSGGRSSREDSSAPLDRAEAEATPSDISVEQSPDGRGGAAVGIVAATSSYDKVDNRGQSFDGTVPAPSAFLPASAAAVALTSSFSSLSSKDPSVVDDSQRTVTGDRNRKLSGEERHNEDGSGSGITVFADSRRLPEMGPLTSEALSGVELVCGDIFREAWNDAGIVYVASLLFDDSMMILLAKHIEKLRRGARVVSLKPIPTLDANGETSGQSRNRIEGEGDEDGGAAGRHGGLQLLHEGVFRMSWQMARVYIYLKC
eukprot:g2124.t2